jgi:hypothetical protein
MYQGWKAAVLPGIGGQLTLTVKSSSELEPSDAPNDDIYVLIVSLTSTQLFLAITDVGRSSG